MNNNGLEKISANCFLLCGELFIFAVETKKQQRRCINTKQYDYGTNQEHHPHRWSIKSWQYNNYVWYDYLYTFNPTEWIMQAEKWRITLNGDATHNETVIEGVYQQ